VSAVIGTHTHVPTADDHILPGGTGFMTDVGMCGDYNSVIGMQKEEPVHRFTTKIGRGRIEPSTGEGTVSGLAIETDDATGLARAVAPFRIGGCLRPVEPMIWS
jgi:calcineurin-like phosphoesterase